MHLVKRKCSSPSSQMYFENRNLDKDISTWKAVYILPRCETISSRLRVFQYKILNTILYLNNRLFKMKLVQDPKCSICKGNAETITHLLVFPLLTNVVNWCGNDIGLPPHLNLRMLLPRNYSQQFQFRHLDKFAYNSFQTFYLCKQRKKTRLSLK